MEIRNQEERKRSAGYSLLEVIIIISIISILGAVIGPQVGRYVSNHRATACKTDREAILAVFERCIYGRTKAFTQGDLDIVLSGGDPKTANEVYKYKKCPNGGNYTGTITGNVAIIHCSEHDDVKITLEGFEEKITGIDPDSDPDPVITPP